VREGDRFDHYVLKEKIASGGMADVFRAERVGAMGVTREVCIKCVRPALCTDAEFVRMFIDEARLSTQLQHANVVAVDHFGQHEGSLFMCMEWVHGTDVARLLKRLHALRRQLPVDAAAFIFAEVLKALEYAHAKKDRQGAWLQIVHRDVTPHNVMVSYAGDVKLTDFGIAKATSRLHQTFGDVIKGKVAYMAPEQALGEALDLRTDLFAVGVVAYELLAGRKPYLGAEQMEGVHAMLRAERTPLRALRPDAPAAVVAIIDRLLENAPADRFEDASAARDALDAVPGLAGGHRTLQRLLRELYAEEQHSTLLPRFADASQAAATEPMRAFDPAPAPTPATGGTDTTLPAPTPPPAASTAPGAPTLTAPPAPAPPPRAEAAPPSLAVTPAPVALPARSPASSAAPRWPLALAGVALAAAVVVLGVAVKLARQPDVPRPPAMIVAPPPAATPSPAPPPPLPAAPSIAPPTPLVVPDAATPDAGAAPAEADEAAHATLSVVAIPWGRITVDGRAADNRGTFRLRPGRYRVLVEQPDVSRRVRTVRLRAGETENLRVNMLEE